MTETLWKDDGQGIVAAGDVGGDVQIGDAYSRRFVHTRLAGRHIEVRAYPAGIADQGDPGEEPTIRLEVQTELMVATDPDDPGGTEVWSDLEYGDLPGAFDRTYPSVEAAERAAKALLELLDPVLHFAWDGKPEMGPASVLKYQDFMNRASGGYHYTDWADRVEAVHGLVKRSQERYPDRYGWSDDVITGRDGKSVALLWVFDKGPSTVGETGGWVQGVWFTEVPS